jgi:hypothetical protein
MDVRSDLLPCFMSTGVIRTRQEVWFGSPGFRLESLLARPSQRHRRRREVSRARRAARHRKLTVHEERTVELIAPPQGGRFKGYTDYVVQDLVIRAHIVNFRCERWQTADGEMMTAPERLNCSPEAARALVKRMRLPRQKATDGKVLVSVDLSEINHKPMPARSPAGDPRSLKAQLAGVVEHERAGL